jgi:hypothetical protein
LLTERDLSILALLPVARPGTRIAVLIFHQDGHDANRNNVAGNRVYDSSQVSVLDVLGADRVLAVLAAG